MKIGICSLVSALLLAGCVAAPKPQRMAVVTEPPECAPRREGWTAEEWMVVQFWPRGQQYARPGDTNCDGDVNFEDINPFVTAIVTFDGFRQKYPGCRWLNSDCNFDCHVDFDDINPFVGLLTGATPQE